jgi:hypothetical protein
VSFDSPESAEAFAAWERHRADEQLQRAIDAWLGPTGTARYVVDRSIPTTTFDGTGQLLGYVYDGVLYVHPDREPLIKAALAAADAEVG